AAPSSGDRAISRRVGAPRSAGARSAAGSLGSGRSIGPVFPTQRASDAARTRGRRASALRVSAGTRFRPHRPGLMVFTSLEFVAFFVVVYALYRVLSHRAQNVMLVVASYVFYGAWDWRFLGLLAA